MSDLDARIRRLRQRIDAACASCGRNPADIDLLPVSKFQPVSALAEAMDLGFRSFGENYVQEGVLKAQALPEARILMQGPLQRNKAKLVLQHFAELMTVDRLDLVLRLRHLLSEQPRILPVWIQVDLWDEATKAGGCPQADLPALTQALQAEPNLPLSGFMAIPPPDHPAAFQELAQLRDQWQDRLGQRLRLSMGMSHDLEDAIRAGADQVRIGSDFFGDRHS